MSIVGPRPERPEFIELLEGVVPSWGRRLLVKPGMTGWAQVRSGYAADCDSTAVKLSYDLWYLRHRNLVIDLAVCAKTFFVVLGLGPREPRVEPSGRRGQTCEAPGSDDPERRGCARALSRLPGGERTGQDGRDRRDAGSDGSATDAAVAVACAAAAAGPLPRAGGAVRVTTRPSSAQLCSRTGRAGSSWQRAPTGAHDRS